MSSLTRQCAKCRVSKPLNLYTPTDAPVCALCKSKPVPMTKQQEKGGVLGAIGDVIGDLIEGLFD